VRGAFCHKLKRIDRLVGNQHLQREAGLVYAALCRVLLAGMTFQIWGGGDRGGLVGSESRSVARDCCAPRCRWAGGH
jgi:hypothetical protein